MKKCLKNYVSEYEKSLNVPLMNKESDAPLVDYVVDAWKSLEAVPNIKFVGYEYSEKESEIDINKYIYKREKKKKKKERYDYKFISDDRYGKLTVHLEISVKEEDKETGKTKIRKKLMKKSMLIPLQDEEGYFYIKGKKYYLIYQLVEKSTYTSNSSVTLKSLMPIAIKRNVIDATEIAQNNITDEKLQQQGITTHDSEGREYRLPVYYVFVFKKEIPTILFYLSKGLDCALEFLSVTNIITFIEKLPDIKEHDYLYFKLSSKCYIQVNRELFNKYPYIQSVVGGFLTVCTNRVTIDSLNDPKVWIKKISNNNTYEKGKDILRFFNRLLDVTTQRILKINDYHKESIYTLIRWMMEEYNELRLKDNMDLGNKRLRCNEYIAAELTKEFSKRTNRIMAMGDKVTMDDFKDMLKFPGEILISKMHTSGVLRYDDNVNDMNFFSKFKYTKPLLVQNRVIYWTNLSNCGNAQNIILTHIMCAC